MSRSYFPLQILYCVLLLVDAIKVLGKTGCPELLNAIVKPKFATQSPPTSLLQWLPSYKIRYQCLPGYRFPGGSTEKKTNCVNSTNGLQWIPKRFPDCIVHSPCLISPCKNNGKCMTSPCKNNGECMRRSNVTGSYVDYYYSCLCPGNFIGRYCEKAFCYKTSVANSALILQSAGDQIHQMMFSVGSIISYICKKGFRIQGENVLTCTSKGEFEPKQPPKCVLSNPFYEYKCDNKYIKNSDGRNVYYSPKKQQYAVGSEVMFHCTPGTHFVQQHGLTRMVSRCKDFGNWSPKWPKCKAKTCQKPPLLHGNITVFRSTQNILTVGSTIKFSCHPSYYLSGAVIATCKSYGYWGTKIPECIDIDVFQNRCMLDGKKMKFRKNMNTHRSVPYCESEPLQGKQGQLNTITIVTATAATVFGVLLLIILMVVFQRRRLLKQFRRAQEFAEAEENFNQEIPGVHFILPSYDEAVRSKPTTDPPTFDETIQRDSVAYLTDELPSYSSPEHYLDNYEAEEADYNNEMREEDGLPPPYPGDDIRLVSISSDAAIDETQLL